jgi:hypothetical protein
MDISSIISKLPRPNYDDYYKYVVSVSTIFLILGLIGSAYFSYQAIVLNDWLLVLPGCFALITGTAAGITLWKAAKHWQKNQILLDQKVENEVKLSREKLEREKTARELDVYKLAEQKSNWRSPGASFYVDQARKDLKTGSS